MIIMATPLYCSMMIVVGVVSGVNGVDRMANKKNVNWRRGLIKRGWKGGRARLSNCFVAD